MDFYKRVAFVCKSIPPGKVATYGQIALLCGKPKNARQVGYALNRELAGVDVPAHRVVNSKGILSGAASFSTPARQKQLLMQEGVRVLQTEEGQKADLKIFGWNHTLEDALLFRSHFEKSGI